MPKVTAKGKGKRYPLNMRTTKEVRDRLEKAAAASGRSLVQEVERRLEDSFIKEEAFGEWIQLYQLLKTYIRMLGVIRKRDKEVEADALHAGLGAIVDAFCSGHLSDDRQKELWLEIIPDLGERGDKGDNNATGIVTDALNVLSGARLVDIDPYKQAKWVIEREAKKRKAKK